MRQQIIRFLQQTKRMKVTLSDLEQAFPYTSYEEFAEEVMQLEQQGIMTRIKSHGENGKTPSLSYSYKIEKHLLQADLRETIKQAKKQFHPTIFIEAFLTQSLAQWHQVVPALEQLNNYIHTHGFPQKSALISDRSYEIFQDEKYISEHGGKALLEKVKVWNLLRIDQVTDPLAFSINPAAMHREHHLHLIVENKATYFALQPALCSTPFTTLIYGAGNAITGTITCFSSQLPLQGTQQFYYFGDLDPAGIDIWYRLSQKIEVQPAVAFYEACFTQPYTLGKWTQRKNPIANEVFANYFNVDMQRKLLTMLEQDGYYPQEVLNGEHLQQIWRGSQWTIQIS